MWILIGDAAVNLNAVSAISMQGDHLYIEYTDGTLTNVSYNSEPECLQQYKHLLQLLGITEDLGGEIVRGDE
jgi:hypothetical protein